MAACQKGCPSAKMPLIGLPRGKAHLRTSSFEEERLDIFLDPARGVGELLAETCVVDSACHEEKATDAEGSVELADCLKDDTCTEAVRREREAGRSGEVGIEPFGQPLAGLHGGLRGLGVDQGVEPQGISRPQVANIDGVLREREQRLPFGEVLGASGLIDVEPVCGDQDIPALALGD